MYNFSKTSEITKFGNLRLFTIKTSLKVFKSLEIKIFHNSTFKVYDTYLQLISVIKRGNGVISVLTAKH